ncbi:MAG: hypothetical protein ACI9WO_002090 [Sphingobacteriales bacterium]|jgi:hypothetical protein
MMIKKAFATLLICFVGGKFYGQNFVKSDLKKVVLNNKISKYSTWTDYNGDAGPDLFWGNVYDGRNEIYMDNDTGHLQVFSPTFAKEGGNTYGSTWGDVDNDGDLDALIYTIFDSRNFFYINVQDSNFKKITTGALINDFTNTFVASFYDVDVDGDVDLYVCDTELWDPTNKDRTNRFYLNDGRGNFTLVESSPLSQISGDVRDIAWGDFNNDGLPDVFLANFGRKNMLFQNVGAGEFKEVYIKAFADDLGDSNTAEFGDFDNDGDLDLFVVNAKSDNFLYKNIDGNFEKINSSNLTSSDEISGNFVWVDYDFDGNLDAFTTDVFTNKNSLFLSMNSQNNWFGLKLRGRSQNRFAVGASVWVKAQINGVPTWQHREVYTRAGRPERNQDALHFGLGDSRTIDSLVIMWPGGGEQVYTNLFANQYLVVEQGSGKYSLPLNDPILVENNHYKDLSIRAIGNISSENNLFTLSLFYKNNGIIPVDAVVKINLDQELELFKAFPNPESYVDKRTVEFKIKQIQPGKEEIITLIYRADGMTEEISADALILPIDFDENKSDNSFKLIKAVTF